MFSEAENMKCESTAVDSGCVSSESQNHMRASVRDTRENSSTEKPGKTKKGKVSSGPYTTVIPPLIDIVPANPDVAHLPGLISYDETLPGPSGIQPAVLPNRNSPESPTTTQSESSQSEPICVDHESFNRLRPWSHKTSDTDSELMLPGAVGEDHGSRKASASSSKKKSRHVFLSDSSSPLPDIANIDIPDDEQTKNKSSTRGFFRKCQKTLRKLFSCGQDLQSNPPLVVEPEKRELKKVQGKANCLPDQVCISHKNNNDSEAAITNQPMLTYGTVVSNYKIVKCIGSGSFAKVYEGFHISDEKKKVAIKHVRKIGNEWYLRMPGHSKPVPSEVAMLLRLGSPPSCPSIIKLQHWVQNEKSVLLFMEMPERSMNLAHYMLFHRISERDAHKIITQLILAVKHCVARQIFHGDLHLGNILVSLPSLHIKLIDFGVASPYNGKPLRRNEYQGHCRYIPPEVLLYPIFEAKPAYVWGLGLVLYKLMHGDVPLKKERKIFDGGFRVKESLSPECRDLIKKCLIRNHWQRLQLENVEKHSWFGLFKEEPL